MEWGDERDQVMKVCQICGDEIGTRDGDNVCRSCEDETSRKKKAAARRRRRERDEVMRSCGMVKVRGAMGGTYWE